MGFQPKVIYLQHSQHTQESGNILKPGTERMYEPEDQHIYYKILSSVYNMEAASMKFQIMIN